MSSSPGRPPFPPFTRDTAAQKARAAEDAWNGRNPQKVAMAYTEDSVWRNRAEFLRGRGEAQVRGDGFEDTQGVERHALL